MPCYDPPRPDVHDYHEMTRQRDKCVETLKDIEAYCKNWTDPISQEILGIIDTHWGKK